MIHVAGILDEAEAEMVSACGVTFLGIPLRLAHHREDVSVEATAAITRRLAGRATFFLITYLDTAPEILELCRRLGVGMVQLHGPVSGREIQRLRGSGRPLRIVKSLIVRGDNLDALAGEVARFAPLVDAFITDTFDAATGATGATGKTHDWTISRRIVETSPKPVILAGGLDPANVRTAIETVRPAGVDAHTGLEGADGRKRPDLVARFVAEARAGFAGV